MFNYILREEKYSICVVFFPPSLLLQFRHYEGSTYLVSHTLRCEVTKVSCLPKQHGRDSSCSPVNHSEVSCFQQKKQNKQKTKNPEFAMLSKREMQLTKDCH